MERFRTIRVGAAIELTMGIPVAHDKAVKAHLPFQDIRQQPFVTRQFLALPRGETRHDRLNTGFQCGRIASAVDVANFFFGLNGIALIAALVRPAIREKMFRGGNHMVAFQPIGRSNITLNTSDELACIGRRDFWIFGITFIGPPPAIITHNGDCRCKGPLLRTDTDLLRRNRADFP